MAYKPFKMKGHTLPGINQKVKAVKTSSIGEMVNRDLDDHPKNVAEQGLSGSSPFQDYKKGYYGEGKSKSPTKYAQYIPMALSILSSLKKDKK